MSETLTLTLPFRFNIPTVTYYAIPGRTKIVDQTNTIILNDISSNSSISYIPTSAGNKVYSLIATDNETYSVTNTNTAPVTVVAATFAVSTNAITLSQPLTFTGSFGLDISSAVITDQSNNNVGSIDISKNTSVASFSKTYTPSLSGSKTYTLKITNANGQFVTNTVNVIVSPLSTGSLSCLKLNITNGQSTTLIPTFSWGTAGTAKIVDASTNAIIYTNVTTTSNYSVSPTQTTVYKLVLTDGNGYVVNSNFISVNVSAKPTITSPTFAINPTVLYKGQTGTNTTTFTIPTITYSATPGLTKIMDASNTVIFSDVSSNSTKTYTPSTSTIGQTVYSLTATDLNNYAVVDGSNPILTITPYIASFTASKTTIKSGTSITLTPSWIIDDSGILSANINPTVGSVTNNSSYTVSPTVTTTYTLTVTDKHSNSTTKTVSITVN